jgi:23S rRNA pseudouridine1911/1915/1917 synthase
MTVENLVFHYDVDFSGAGRRLDLFLSSVLSDCSRSRAADLIRSGSVTVCGSLKKPGYRLQAGECVDGRIPVAVPTLYRPEPIPIEILFEDAHLLIVNKKPGMVVHPAPGHDSGTLVNALLHHCTDLPGIGGELRPGIVHRLDKETSGTMVVAKTETVLNHLAAQFKRRTVGKTYLALVLGRVKEESGEILLPIGRHQTHRKKMSVRSRHARTAHTQWKVRERYIDATLLEVTLKTGRTHQIRVHCAAIGHGILGDTVYGGRKQKSSLRIHNREGDALPIPGRQMLHSWRLSFVHPVSGIEMTFESPVPKDMAEVMEGLKSVLLEAAGKME